VKTNFGLCLALLFLGSALRAEGEAVAPRPPLEVFQTLGADVETAVREGRLPEAAAAAAQELAFDLERDLILHDAGIAVLRLEVTRFDGEAQQAALDRLIAAAAARELAVVEQIRRLETLAAGSPAAGLAAWSLEIAPPIVPAELPSDQAGSEASPREGLGWNLDFEAQDMIDDPDPF
jgi:hypothetical protein